MIGEPTSKGAVAVDPFSNAICVVIIHPPASVTVTV